MSGVGDFSYAFSSNRNEAGLQCPGLLFATSNPKAGSFVGTGLAKWITSSVTTLSYTFYGASAMNSNLGGWDVGKVKDMQSTFGGDGQFCWFICSLVNHRTGLTSCNKRLIADAWKSSAAFTATNTKVGSGSGHNLQEVSYDTDWASATCPIVPCTTGSTWSASGNAPCATCADASTCAAGVKTACTKTTNTVCKIPCVAGSTWSTSGYTPCALCAAGSTCTAGGVKTACTKTTNTVCEVPCVAGSSWSTSGYTPCASCTAEATCTTGGVKTACADTADTVCHVRLLRRRVLLHDV